MSGGHAEWLWGSEVICVNHLKSTWHIVGVQYRELWLFFHTQFSGSSLVGADPYLSLLPLGGDHNLHRCKPVSTWLRK